MPGGRANATRVTPAATRTPVRCLWATQQLVEAGRVARPPDLPSTPPDRRVAPSGSLCTNSSNFPPRQLHQQLASKRANVSRVLAMFILIVGSGRVGSAVAKRALDAGHEVSVLDSDPLSHERLDKDQTTSWEDAGG